MREKSCKTEGMRALIDRYRSVFRVPENLNHYSSTDYKIAERKFVKYALAKGEASERTQYSGGVDHDREKALSN